MSNAAHEMLMTRATVLKLYGLLAHWDEVKLLEWVEPLITWEEQERQERSLQRRLSSARIGSFKPRASKSVENVSPIFGPSSLPG